MIYSMRERVLIDVSHDSTLSNLCSLFYIKTNSTILSNSAGDPFT